MEQRLLRLGEIVDDYCPRERRLTNHAIVAIVGQVVKQTRCMTCDAEHAFKNGKEPRPRRKEKDETSELYAEVLSNVGGQLVAKGGSAADDPAAVMVEVDTVTTVTVVQAASAANGNGSTPPSNGAETPADSADQWLSHRPLIRATLPRQDGQPPTPRPIPEFTIRQQGMRGERGFRSGQNGGGGGWQDRNGQPARNDGFRSGSPNGHGRPHGHGGGRPGQGQGQGQGGGQQPGGGRSRGRGRRPR